MNHCYSFEIPFGVAGILYHNSPLAMLMPCHRVVKDDMPPGVFSGGERLKEKMPAMEFLRCGMDGGSLCDNIRLACINKL